MGENQDQLDKEGLTKEFLSTIPKKPLLSPVQLSANDSPVNLINCATGFWVSLNGEVFKDSKGAYLVISEKEAFIGRARYLLNFQDEIKQKKIDKEVKRLKKLVDDELGKAVENLKRALIYEGSLFPESGFEGLVYKVEEEQRREMYKRNVEKAKELVTDKTLPTYELLCSQVDLEDKKDYDFLYSWFFQGGTYQIASFDNSASDMSTLVKFFHKDSIEETISEIGKKSHLENVAKFNIEKNETL